MSEPDVCRHCGYFTHWLLPKAPDVPHWVHALPYRPDKPTNGDGPCDHPEPAIRVFSLPMTDEDWADTEA